MTTIVNLYAGPGCGKSTSAAYLYYLMKSDSLNAELVREYVKEWAWEKRNITTYDQLYFLGHQIRREAILLGKADWVVTDSPSILGTFYANKYSPKLIADGVNSAISSYYAQAKAEGHKHVHVVLQRSKPYIQVGRYQTKEEAEQFDVEIADMLTNKGINFIESGTDDDDLKLLYNKLKSL